MSSSNFQVKSLGSSSLAMSVATVNGFSYYVAGSTSTVLQATWTATPTGSWNFQTSQNGVNFSTIIPAASGTQTMLSSDATVQFIMSLMPSVRYVRLQWVGTAGTATATVTCDVSVIEM